MPGRAPGRVEPDGVPPGQVDFFRAGGAHLDRIPERAEVVGGEGGGHRIGIDREHVEPAAGERERVAADAAAEVGDPADARPTEARRVVRGHGHPRRLLDTRAREQHARGERAELRLGAQAQPRLADDGGDEVGGVSLRAQAGDRAGDVGGRLDGVEGVEQREPLGGEQRVEFSLIHESHSPVPPDDRPRSRRALALALHECQASSYAGISTLGMRVRTSLPSKQRKKRYTVSVSIKPLEDRIVIKQVEAEQTTASGLVIPDTAKEKPQEGEVVAVGPGRIDDNGNRVPLDVAVGDRVLYSKYGGTEVKFGADEYLVLSARDVLAVVVR